MSRMLKIIDSGTDLLLQIPNTVSPGYPEVSSDDTNSQYPVTTTSELCSARIL